MSEQRPNVLSLKISDRARRQLDALAERWRASRTAALEHAIDVLAAPDLGAAIGGEVRCLEQAAKCWAELIRQTAPEVEKQLERAEWNFLAAANNGLSPLLLCDLPSSHAFEVVQANADAAHALHRAGDQWFGAKQADARVRSLLAKLAKLNFAEGWCVALALQFFWASEAPGREEINPEKAPWWTLDYRRQYAARAGK